MKNYYFKKDRTVYQNKILDILDNALNDLSSEDFDILIQIIQEYLDDLYNKQIKDIIDHMNKGEWYLWKNYYFYIEPGTDIYNINGKDYISIR